MARAGLLDHRKFKKLVYLLREPIPHCVGYLECLWTVAYQQRSAYLGDCLDVELAAQYPGDQGKLCSALLQSGFIDAIKDGKYQVHDLDQHAPRHVKKALTERPMSAQSAPTERSTDDQTEEKHDFERPMSAQSAPTEHQEKRREEKRREEEEKEEKKVVARATFAPPTADEVQAYCQERGNSVDPEKFVDHYTSNGWKVGRSSMKDWKAAVRTWEKNGFGSHPGRSPPARATKQRVLTEDEISHGEYNGRSFTPNTRTCEDENCQRPECVAQRATLWNQTNTTAHC